MRIAFASILLLAVLALQSVSAAQDTPGTSDHPLVTRYAGSVLDGYDFSEFDEFVLPLGPVVKDANGERVPSEKAVLEGKVTRLLYHGPENRSTLEIIRNYRSALQDSGFEILFECSGDDGCGRLFHWPLWKGREIKNTKTAARAFDKPSDIRYLAAGGEVDGAPTHVSVLVAIDAIWTKQPETLLEIIEGEPMDVGMVTVNAEAMAKGLDAEGHISIYGIYFDTDSDVVKDESSETLQQIKALMDDRPDLNLLVVGHTDNQGGYDYNMDLSTRRAESVVGALVDRYGISADHLTGYGVGFLAPVASNDNEEGRAKNRRVELVKR